MAIQQLYVRLQQFQETLATILQAARNELVEQVQNATSTTTHEEPMIRADRLFKLRSYPGAVDQRNKLEPVTTTEESSTPRLNRALSMLMYYILVMMKTLYRCRNARMSEEFAERRQFVKEWEPRFVGLLRNVLSCRRKDDVPTQLSETVIDDTMMDVDVLGMEDERVEICLIWKSTRIANWIQVRKEIHEITKTRQYVDSNLVPVQIGVQPKSMDKNKHGKDPSSSVLLRPPLSSSVFFLLLSSFFPPLFLFFSSFSSLFSFFPFSSPFLPFFSVFLFCICSPLFSLDCPLCFLFVSSAVG